MGRQVYRSGANLGGFRFTGEDSDIDIATEEPEFARWKWTDVENLVREIVDFKRDIYRDVLATYQSWSL